MDGTTYSEAECCAKALETEHQQQQQEATNSGGWEQQPDEPTNYDESADEELLSQPQPGVDAAEAAIQAVCHSTGRPVNPDAAAGLRARVQQNAKRKPRPTAQPAAKRPCAKQPSSGQDIIRTPLYSHLGNESVRKNVFMDSQSLSQVFENPKTI